MVSTAGIVHEFTSIDRDHCDVIEQYLRGCGVAISVSLQASNRGHGGMFGDLDMDEMGSDDSDDADFEAAPDSSSGEYTEDLKRLIPTSRRLARITITKSKLLKLAQSGRRSGRYLNVMQTFAHRTACWLCQIRRPGNTKVNG